MFLANFGATAHAYHEILTTDLSVLIHSHDNSINILFPKNMTIEKFVNDGLMVIFFFVVGLEIKREILEGELSSLKKATLPILAAIGGMLVPALIYLVINGSTPYEMGWGIPMATDIAFAIAILSMLGSKVPISLKIFLTALAIADDLGAIIVIALFYGGEINLLYLAIALVIMCGVYIINRLGERRFMYYAVPAVVVWSLFYYSGVHATISGVAMAMLIPMTPRYSRRNFLRQTNDLEARIVSVARRNGMEARAHYYDLLNEIKKLTRGAVPLSVLLEEKLTPIVTFVVMPIFALVNGGVMISGEHMDMVGGVMDGTGSIGLGIILGLVVGKPLGIMLMSWLAVKSKLAVMPSRAGWGMMLGVACLSGIGFTMSIFVDSLAFLSVNLDWVNQGKIAILLGSLLSAILGVVVINVVARRKRG